MSWVKYPAALALNIVKILNRDNSVKWINQIVLNKDSDVKIFLLRLSKTSEFSTIKDSWILNRENSIK